MHLWTCTTTIAALHFASRACADELVPYQRLNKNDSALLIVDHQVGLAAQVRDWDATVFKNAILGHAGIGRIFDLPVVITTSVENGPNGPLPREILEMYPNVPIIARPGEIDAWDNSDFRAAVKATGRRQMIVAGITTDVCVASLALSLRAEGYHVAVNIEASGAFNERIANAALTRMQAAGVQLMNFFSINSELFRDWRNTKPSANQTLPFMDQYIAQESWVLRSHAAALDSGSLVGTENETITPSADKAMCLAI